MTSIEIHFRVVTMRERIQQLQGEFLAIGEELHSEVSLQILGRAERKLHEASEALQAVATANNPAAGLRTSVAEREERRQCAATGAEVLRFPGA